MIKKLFRIIHQWFCAHESVYVKSNAGWKQNANNMMLVRCATCDKKIYMLGKDIVLKWSKDKDCQCKYSKY